MRPRIRPPDLIVALVVGVVQLGVGRGAYHGQPDRLPTDLVGYLLLLAGPIMLAARRRWPVATLMASVVVTIVYIMAGYAYGPPFLAPIILLYTAVTTGHRRAAWLTAGGFFAFILAYTTWVAPVPTAGLWHDFSVAAVILVVLTVSEIVRAQRERKAERRRVAEEEGRRQASEERLTMAQELHDVLAHNISLIHVQASTALHLIDDQPEQARTALATIKVASKDVLGEMRSVLNVLRDGAPRSPTAGLDRLEELIERTGLPVTRKTNGEIRPLPPSVERAVYRIIQESLTNVTRHAPGAAVTVTLTYGPGTLVIQVTDEGSAAPGSLTDAGSGNGIPGMRERASALGGTLSAGPYHHGFRVEARLPIPEEKT
ncbi:histidine kinase [Streptosporangium soli]|nr:histidine kinase [Streptosporangium sp. KLBMP 9127]